MGMLWSQTLGIKEHLKGDDDMTISSSKKKYGLLPVPWDCGAQATTTAKSSLKKRVRTVLNFIALIFLIILCDKFYLANLD